MNMFCVISSDKESNTLINDAISQLPKSSMPIDNFLEENMLLQMNTYEKSQIIIGDKLNYYYHSCENNKTYKLQKNTPYIFTSSIDSV